MKGKFTFSCVLTLTYEIDAVTGFFSEHTFKKKIWHRILPGTTVLSISLGEKKCALKLDYLLYFFCAKLISSFISFDTLATTNEVFT